MKVSKYSQENNSETVTNKHDKEILKERYISSEEKKLLMTWDQYNSTIKEYQKIINLLDKMQNQLSKFKTKIGLK